jgi:hypothetical protein
MRQTSILLSLLACSAVLGTAFAADSQLMNLVMPDAKILAGVNATSVETSPLGQFILAKIGLNGGQLPTDVFAAIGFNPLQDVTEILAATAADPSNPGGLVMARGTFPVDKFTAALSAHKNVQISAYGGATLISTTNPKEKVALAVAFIGTSIAVAGDLASVKAAVDRSTGSNSIDPALAVTVNQLSGSEDEWVASSASIASLLPANFPAPATTGTTAVNPVATVLPLLKNIQSFNGGVKFGANVAVTGEIVTNSEQNAAALDAVIKLGLILASSATSKNPQLTDAVKLLQALQVTTNGSAVDLSLSIPEAQIETLVNSIPVTKQAVARVRPRSPEILRSN